MMNVRISNVRFHLFLGSLIITSQGGIVGYESDGLEVCYPSSAE